jgi:hypothetical protein
MPADCRTHWKANHKQNCIAQADRAPQLHEPAGDGKEAASRAAAAGGECIICLNPLTEASACTLPCAHVFHAACVAEMRKFGVQQACPLCRAPLPPGPERLIEDATRRYLVVQQRVARGEASWSALPAAAHQEVDAAARWWRAAADQGHPNAQLNLGIMFANGSGAPQSDVEAARWYQKLLLSTGSHIPILYENHL